MLKNNQDTILALDPGLRDLGYAVLRSRRVLTSGVRPLRLLPAEQRLREARRLVRSWIAAYRPGTLILEATYPHPVAGLDAVHRLAASVRSLARRHGITVAVYPPQSVRKTLTGHGWACKWEAAVAVSYRFPALRVYLTQDRKWKERYFQNMFDAVALALHHQAHAA